MRKICLLGMVLFTCATFAEDSAKAHKLNHDSEAGVILASGNSETQTYSLKQSTSYAWSDNLTKLTGSYLLGKTSGTETAKKWDLGLRYELGLSGQLSLYSSYQIDSLPFAGTNLRHTIDLGGKYSFFKKEHSDLGCELGYRLTKESFTSDNGKTSLGYLTSHMSRLYLEWNQKWNSSVGSKIWGEYLQSYTILEDYRLNLEPSFSVLLNDVFSVKLAYLVNFRNVPAVSGKKKIDTLYTTSLVAKF